MSMSKNEIINYLTEANVKFNEKATYKELLKLFYNSQNNRFNEIINEDIPMTKVGELPLITNNNLFTDVTSSKVITEPIVFEQVTEITSSSVIEVNDELSIREKLIIDIIKLMGELRGKTKGTPQEIKKMFELYNNFYKRSETPACSICIGNVHAKMMSIYKKYK